MAKADQTKSVSVQTVIAQMLTILNELGLPLTDQTHRRQECVAMAVLALADITHAGAWRQAKSIADQYSLTTRKIIQYWNTHFEEQISSGSYDDVRQRDLIVLLRVGIVVASKASADTNDGTRGYGITPEFAQLLHLFGTAQWEPEATGFRATLPDYATALGITRNLIKIPIILPNNHSLLLGSGKHNELQRTIIEELLPRWGHAASVLYIGDATDKDLYVARAELEALQIRMAERTILPDVIAYSRDTHRLFLIEAVHSSGTISNERRTQLQALTQHSSVTVIYVTAFLDWDTFRRFVKQIGWGTQVWIAAEPDHMIHFNGEHYL